MTRSKPITFLASAAVLPLIALSVAACGGGGAATASPPSSKTTSTPAKTATIRVANSSLGSILVDSQGRTLYLFKADSATMSACSGACATAWPPLLTKGKPTAGNGLSATKLATIKRSGGERQVTYNGHPLYLFVMDQRPGQTAGQGVVAFGAAWFAVSPAGNQVAAHPSSAAKPAPKSAAKPAPHAAPKPASPASNGIPQNNGGDGDSDNNGGPSDGDGNL